MLLNYYVCVCVSLITGTVFPKSVCARACMHACGVCVWVGPHCVCPPHSQPPPGNVPQRIHPLCVANGSSCGPCCVVETGQGQSSLELVLQAPPPLPVPTGCIYKEPTSYRFLAFKLLSLIK